ncbi:alpha-L-fucosidase [Chitinophaga sp. YR573]|uniref:sialidase family protein n=1 Tax=Chitinophaga sp. YR573 TaxID=1881040 RepID=UPI0008B939C1|nr:sialidase family protein [Chitinophaga sp. YR573]SEW01550.1 alpha-L-fucosidase [Chitinophaga sp. YR573]
MKNVLLSCMLVGSSLVSYAQVDLVKEEFLMQHPPVPAAHASTITELPGGQLLASWFGGSRESAPDVCIYTSVFAKGKWSAPVIAATGIVDEKTRYAAWNPVLITTRAHKLLLFYKVGPNPREWWGLMKYSTDKGRTWSKEEKLPEGILGPIKNKPVQLANGTILHPSSTESKDEKQWHIHVELSDSTGHNWRSIPINCDTFGVIQPSALFHPGGRLQLLCRSRQNVIVQTFSDDNGETWSPLTRQTIMNPNSGIDAVTTKSGLQVLIYNPAKMGADWSDGRNELRVAVSKDGENWHDVYELEKQPKGEFSYPAVIQTKDGLLHITYTYNRQNIKHVVLKLKKM